MAKERPYGSNKAKLLVNAITISRFLAAFALIPIYFQIGGAAAAAFLIAMFATDFIDGTLARGLRVSSFFGALADSVSDKVLAILASALLMPTHPLLMTSLLGLEALIFAHQIQEGRKGNHIASDRIGKVKTWVLAATIIGGYALSDMQTVISFVETLPSIIANAVTPALNVLKSHPTESLTALTALSAIFQLATFATYAHSGKKQDAARKEQEEAYVKGHLTEEEQNILAKPKEEVPSEALLEIETKIKRILQEKEALQKEKYELKSKKEIVHDLFDTQFFETHQAEQISKLVYKPKQEE